MERQRDRAEELLEEKEAVEDEEVLALKKELARLRLLKRQTEQLKLKAVEKAAEAFEKENNEITSQETEPVSTDNVDQQLDKIEDFLTSELGKIDEETYKQYAGQVESELQKIEREIVGEKRVIEEEISAYERLLQEYPWLEEKKYLFMYSMPDKKKNASDYESWKTEWSKVLFDYARFAILHILYLRQLNSEKPFSNFEKRDNAIREIAEELVEQKLAKFLSKKKDKVRIYWRDLEVWADEIYDWAMENSPLEPILIHEIREANQDFSNLPMEDLIEIFKMLSKENKGEILKLDGGKLAFKLFLS